MAVSETTPATNGARPQARRSRGVRDRAASGPPAGGVDLDAVYAVLRGLGVAAILIGLCMAFMAAGPVRAAEAGVGAAGVQGPLVAGAE